MVARVTSCTSDVAPMTRSSILTKRLHGNGAGQRHSGTLGVPHERVPLAPERPHLQRIIHERLGALHATRHVGPLDLAVGETLLAGFERFHVVRGGKSARPKKR